MEDKSFPGLTYGITNDTHLLYRYMKTIQKIVAATHEMPKMGTNIMEYKKRKTNRHRDSRKRIHWSVSMPQGKEEWAVEIEAAFHRYGIGIQTAILEVMRDYGHLALAKARRETMEQMGSEELPSILLPPEVRSESTASPQTQPPPQTRDESPTKENGDGAPDKP